MLDTTARNPHLAARNIENLVNATDSLDISAGVLKPSVLRGLSFNFLAIALS